MTVIQIGWECGNCGKFVDSYDSNYKCSYCGQIDKMRFSMKSSLLHSDDLPSLALGSTSSISDSIQQQTSNYDELKKELDSLKKIVKKKTKDINEKESKVTSMEKIISNLEETVKNLETENTTLMAYNEAFKDVIEAISKQKFQLQLLSSSQATQEQIQMQFQDQSIDLKLYREIISQAEIVEKEIKSEPDKYKMLSKAQKMELNKIIKDLKEAKMDSKWSKIKHKILNSKLYTYVTNSKNVSKISEGLICNKAEISSDE